MSRMSTTCPNCTLHLAVTAADLRVGQGYVRCGRCERVFNALISLAEDPEVVPVSGDVATGTTTLPALALQPEQERESASEPGSTSGQELVAAAFETPAPTPQEPEPESDVDVVETMATGTFETIVLEGDGVLQTEEMVDESEVEEALKEIADQMDPEELSHLKEHIHGVFDTAPRPDSEAPADTPRLVTESRAPEPQETREPAFEDDFSTAAPPVHRGWVWGAAALALLLVVQVINHNRASLAGVDGIRSVLAPVYRLFGVTLEPRWRLADYDVRQLGGEALADLPEHILLRASVLNRASHPQPLPVLRVTLQDRFGNALSRHDVQPQDYLPLTPPARLGADERLDAELVLPDPGNLAVGFELDACLPDSAGTPHCASRP